MATEAFVLKAGKPTINKDPDAIKDYTIDFVDWLDTMTDVIASVVIEVVGVTLVRFTFNGTEVTVWVSGGTIGETASATARITTVGTPYPRTEDRTIFFKIKEQ